MLASPPARATEARTYVRLSHALDGATTGMSHPRMARPRLAGRDGKAAGGVPRRVRRMDHPSPAAARRDQSNPDSLALGGTGGDSEMVGEAGNFQQSANAPRGAGQPKFHPGVGGGLLDGQQHPQPTGAHECDAGQVDGEARFGPGSGDHYPGECEVILGVRLVDLTGQGEAVRNLAVVNGHGWLLTDARLPRDHPGEAVGPSVVSSEVLGIG